MTLNEIGATFMLSFFATALATPLCIPLIKALGLYDDPRKRLHPASIHKNPIPRGGGIPLFIGITIAGIVFLPINKITLSLFAASLLSLTIGVFDDKQDVSPYVRFVFNVVAAAIVVGSGVSIPFITNPFNGILHLDTIRISLPILGQNVFMLVSDLAAILWIVWVMNMLNWSKGVDGQMPGIVAISSLVIGLVSLRFGNTEDVVLATLLSFILAGSSLGFLLFNFYPARIFPGYGATAVYLLLSVVSLLSSAKLATAILVMGVPMVDGAFTVIRRILSGRSPFWHDNQHLHHLLLRLGFGQRSIALFYWSISAILGALSLALSSRGKLFAIMMLTVLAGGTILFLHLAFRGSDGKKVT